MIRIGYYFLSLFLGLILSLAVFGIESISEDGLFAHFNTSEGLFVIQLEYEKNPISVNNFMALVEGHYYDKMTIDIKLDDYLLGFGRTEKKTPQGLGYNLPLEINSESYFDQPYILFADRLGSNSAVSNVWLSLKPDSLLNGKYGVLGKVISGQEMLSSLKKGSIILNVRIEKKGENAQNFAINLDEEKARFFAMRYPQVAKFLKTWEEYESFSNGLFVRKIENATPDKKIAKEGERIEVHYAGRLLDGSEFDSSYVSGKPMSITLGGRSEKNLIAGFRYIVRQMHPGDHWEVLIPPELAYGEKSVGPIPSQAWLIFEMELLD